MPTAETTAKQAASRFVTEIDPEALAARVAEAAMDLRRPAAMSDAQALDELNSYDPETVRAFRRIAQAAIAYFAECVSKGSQPS